MGIGVLAGILQGFLGDAEQLEFHPFIQMLGDIRTVQLYRHGMVPVAEYEAVEPVWQGLATKGDGMQGLGQATHLL